MPCWMLPMCSVRYWRTSTREEEKFFTRSGRIPTRLLKNPHWVVWYVWIFIPRWPFIPSYILFYCVSNGEKGSPTHLLHIILMLDNYFSRLAEINKNDNYSAPILKNIAKKHLRDTRPIKCLYKKTTPGCTATSTLFATRRKLVSERHLPGL